MSWGLDLSGSLAHKLYTGPRRNKFSRGKTAELKRLLPLERPTEQLSAHFGVHSGRHGQGGLGRRRYTLDL